MWPSNEIASDVFRLIVDPPGDGAWNMAVDEALAEAVAEDQKPTLRIYRWERPTLSLGYFQAYAERDSHPPSRGVDVVRRLSGGGAIVHDQELTYSLVVPMRHAWATDTQALYRTVHRGIIAWLNSLVTGSPGWRITLNDPRQHHAAEKPFLCFMRRAKGDVVVVGDAGDHKVAGSAQRRRHGSILQHGSILWATSAAAPELCGFTQLADRQTSLDEAARRLASDLPALLGLQCERVPIWRALAQSAENKRKGRYESVAWTQRR